LSPKSKRKKEKIHKFTVETGKAEKFVRFWKKFSGNAGNSGVRYLPRLSGVAARRASTSESSQEFSVSSELREWCPLTDPERKLIEDSGSSILTFSDGQTIFETTEQFATHKGGDASRVGFYKVDYGIVEVVSADGSIRNIKQGRFFGEGCFYGDNEKATGNTAMMRANGSTVLKFIPASFANLLFVSDRSLPAKFYVNLAKLVLEKFIERHKDNLSKVTQPSLSRSENIRVAATKS